MDAKRASNSLSFSSSDEQESSSCDESTNSGNFDQGHQQVQEKRFYSSDDEFHFSTRTRGRKRLQTLQESANNSPKQKCADKELSSLRRLPTRRPDPNTFNRNAIMARENRRKKKEYVEKLENEVDAYKSENKKLRKMLKHQFKMVEKVSHERSYLRSVLANKTQIMSLINVIKSSKLLPSEKEVVAAQQPSLQLSAATGLAELTEPDYDLSMDFGKLDETYLPSPSESNVLNDPFEFASNHRHKVNSEHNYFAGNNNDVEDPGVCLHVSGGLLSLEFCSSCNDNAKHSWLDAN